MSENKGFDISRLRGEFKAWVPFQEGSMFLIKYLPQDQTSQLTQKATSVKFHKHQAYDQFDPARFNELLALEAVQDWKNVKDGDKEIPFSKEELVFMVKKSHDFARFLNDTAVDLQKLQEAKEEEDAKNSELTSGQEQTSQG